MVINPAKLVKLKLSTPEEYVIKNGPNQPVQIKVFLHVLPLQGSHIIDIVPPKCFTMPMVPKDSGYHIHHQECPFLVCHV